MRLAPLKVALPCVLAALLVVPASAAAHAVLIGATPPLGARLLEPPRTLKLEYDVPVVPQFARVAVLTPQGENIAGAPQVNGTSVVVALRSGGKGSYTVRWRMVSSDDGHVTEGAFSFGVRAAALAPVPISGAGIPAAPELLAWLQFVGVVLAGGMLTFRALVWVPATRGLGERSGRDSSVALWVGIGGAVVALHAALFGFLVGSYPIVGGGLVSFADTLIIPIRTATHLGQAWTLTTFAWLGVLALLVGAWVTPRRREPLMAGAGLLSLCTAFGISWASHPDSHGAVALGADYVHLLAGALWVGGLVWLAVAVGLLRPASRVAREATVRAFVVRFSREVVPVVAVLALAGLYLALRELPGVSALVDTRYGITLLIKSLVAIAALSFGAYHHRSVVPRIEGGASVAEIRRTLGFEVTLVLVALALAATLSQTAPPR
jgi:copper transport protein